MQLHKILTPECVEALRVAENCVNKSIPTIRYNPDREDLGHISLSNGNFICRTTNKNIECLLGYLDELDYCPRCGQKLVGLPKDNYTGTWQKVMGVMTPGGDPCYVCSVCGKGEHLHGVENPHAYLYCPDCGSMNKYE